MPLKDSTDGWPARPWMEWAIEDPHHTAWLFEYYVHLLEEYKERNDGIDHELRKMGMIYPPWNFLMETLTLEAFQKEN